MSVKIIVISFFIAVSTLLISGNIEVKAIDCPASFSSVCAPSVYYTKNVISTTYTLPANNVCFEYDANGNLRVDTYVSHIDVNCRSGKDDSEGNSTTICDHITTCSIAPVCTCKPPAGGACSSPVAFTNKRLEVYESTAGNYAVSYMFDLDALVYGDIDISTGAQEKYDIYKSDASGNALVDGTYISISENRNYIGDDQGNNIDSAVLIDKTTGVRNPATTVVSKLNGTSLPSWADDMSYNALGEPDNRVTYMGDLHSRLTLGYSTNSTCPPASPIPQGQCSMTKVYSSDWVEISPTAFRGLSVGTKVNFCVNGVTNTDTFDSGRFTINGVAGSVSALTRPGTNDFCSSYTIPANTYTFKIQGEIHHKTLGWL